MDLLFYDLAAQNINTMFVSASGRAYEDNRKGGPRSTLGGITRYYWGDRIDLGPGMTFGMMKTKNYELPPVLAEIATDSSTVIIKQSNGLDISELKAEGYYETDNRSMMMQWGMECFTNAEIVRNSMAHIRNCNMFSNEFVGGFKILDFTLINWLHLEPLINRILNPQSDGVAIQKGKQTFWITEAGSKTKDGSFGEFVEKIKNNTVNFNQETLELSYQTNEKTYQLKFSADFKIDGENANTNYNRYDSPYIKARKKDETLIFNYNGKSLFLDFDNLIRICQ